jgi:hypothetical protein
MNSNQRSLQYFDHNFKGELHTTEGNMMVDAFGKCAFAKRAIEMVCKGSSFEIIEDIGLTARKQAEVPYTLVR